MSRAQILRVSAALGAALVAVAFTIVKKGNDFAVTAAVSTGGATPVVVDVADDAGKIRVFKDIDDFVKAAAKASLISSLTDISFTFTNLSALEPSVFTGDIVARTRSVIASYAKNVTALGLVSSGLASALTLLPSGTPGEIAYKDEKTLQKATVDANVTFMSAEIVRLTALLPAV